MGIIIFFSYATDDAELFKIRDIAEGLESYEEIDEVLYWQRDTKDNIVKFMNDALGKSNIFILFCSKNTLNSKPVENEWTAAVFNNIPIIPVFEKLKYIPPLLKNRRGHKFNTNQIEKNIKGIYSLILKKIPKKKLKQIEYESSSEVRKKFKYYIDLGMHYLTEKNYEESLKYFNEAKKCCYGIFDSDLTIITNKLISEVKFNQKHQFDKDDEKEEEPFEEEIFEEVEENIDTSQKEEAFEEKNIGTYKEFDEEIEEETYIAKYSRISRIKSELLFDGDIKIRLAGEAKPLFAYHMDIRIIDAIREIIDQLPRRTRGESKGQLKRITIMKRDFDNFEIDKNFQASRYLYIGKIRSELLFDGDIKIRLSKDAKDLFDQLIGTRIKNGVRELINRLPRSTKGQSKGELKRITIMVKDFDI
ncbi:MAG: toll/interleukin-1 receptor domain-containing protein [Promethearchaeota archaeon]